MWSRLTVVVRHAPHWQVRFRLLVLLRPTWRSHTWSCRGLVLVVSSSRERGRRWWSNLHRALQRCRIAHRSLATDMSSCQWMTTVRSGLALARRAMVPPLQPVPVASQLVQLARPVQKASVSRASIMVGGGDGDTNGLRLRGGVHCSVRGVRYVVGLGKGQELWRASKQRTRLQMNTLRATEKALQKGLKLHVSRSQM